MGGTFMSPGRKAKREAYLDLMRQCRPGALKKLRSKVNSANASIPHPWARGPLSYMLERMEPGESVWLPQKSSAVHSVAKTARRKIVTRTVFRDGEQGVRVTVVK